MLNNTKSLDDIIVSNLNVASFLYRRSKVKLPQNAVTWPEFALLTRRLASRWSKMKVYDEVQEANVENLNSWADSLERAIAEGEKQQIQSKTKSKSKAKRTTKKGQKQRQTT